MISHLFFIPVLFALSDSLDGAINHRSIRVIARFESNAQSAISETGIRPLRAPSFFLDNRVAVLSISGRDLSRLRSHPLVVSVNYDRTLKLQPKEEVYKFEAANWGSLRIRTRENQLQGGVVHRQSSLLGQNVRVYIMDSGIHKSHEAFSGRIKEGWFAYEGTSEDFHGHGTHVAGIVGGNVYGVASSVDIVPVKIMDKTGNCKESDIIKAIEWISEDCDRTDKCIVNMSFSGPPSEEVDRAVNGLIDKGITVVAASGNHNKPALAFSPGRLERVITVGASTIDDLEANYSNYGSGVTLFAPGSRILSAHIGSDKDVKVLSGTSMAAPHVSGVIAQYLSLSEVSNSPEEILALLVRETTKGVLNCKVEDSPNELLFAFSESALEASIAEPQKGSHEIN